ncbi:MAG: sulfatase family protein [Planctomycetota bacterium]|jgi:arylsulfatase A-like enzyme
MEKPNIIVINLDNLGYGDVGCYGSTLHRTPNIDQFASEGIRLTSYYSVSGVCTPSRAGLMTGCYPRRVNMHVSGNDLCVLFPSDHKGLHPDEKTVATLLREQGYATACVGKWHLGDQDEFLPTRHGFDQFFGCPYSEDMVPNEHHPDRPPLPLMRNETVVESGADRDTLTRRYTEESIQFITENRDRPFFLYLPHAMPGSTDRPFASEPYQGQSANGPYGDAVEELDWSQGAIMKALKDLDLDEKTLVIWTSDNGAVGWKPPQGSNAPLKGWGYDTSEGGQRMPCIARWPGKIPAGVVRDDVTSMMDILPTVLHLAGGEVPTDRTIDGRDILGILKDEEGAESPYDDRGFFYYYREQLQAVRSGPWKLYLPLEKKMNNLGGNMENAQPSVLELYDVRNDVSEEKEVSADHPEVVERLLALAETAREDLGDLDREGRDQRPAGWVETPRPQLLTV